MSAGRAGEGGRVRPPDGPSKWSYYGAAHRYDVHGGVGAERACRERMDRLVLGGCEAELRALAGAGDRCAFIALVELLVDADRTGDLREMAEAGDGRARTALVELLADRGREEELRAEADRGDGAALRALVGLMVGGGRTGEALALLDGGVHPGLERQARALRLQVLLGAGMEEEVRRMAGAGDRAAARALVDRAFERGDTEGLAERARAGDDRALWRWAELLASSGRADAAEAVLRPRAEQGHPYALDLIRRLCEGRTGDLRG
ncbi:hypothetical protein J0910_16675 [Nocardiopsis sp. CNT-189]|uniref:hypothetical protein n=1 Tax=Nocardiopsis oceanisediminis TaxID=2816862 RepID=UPI003B3851FE